MILINAEKSASFATLNILLRNESYKRMKTGKKWPSNASPPYIALLFLFIMKTMQDELLQRKLSFFGTFHILSQGLLYSSETSVSSETLLVKEDAQLSYRIASASLIACLFSSDHQLLNKLQFSSPKISLVSELDEQSHGRPSK